MIHIHDVDNRPSANWVQNTFNSSFNDSTLLALQQIYEKSRQSHTKNVDGKQEEALFEELEIERSTGTQMKEIYEIGGER